MAQDIVLGRELGDEFDQGVAVANKVTVKVDGTSVVKAGDGTLGAAAPTYDNVAKTITFPAVNGGAPQVVDLSEFTTDIHVNGGSFDALTSTLTLSDNDGVTPDITIDLSALVGGSSDGNNILTNGADGKPTLSAATVDALATVQLESVFGTQIASAFPY